MRRRTWASLAAVVALGAWGCGGDHEFDDRVKLLREDLSLYISASPNPCLVGVGQQVCSTTVTWNASGSGVSATSYQVFASMDSGEYKYMACSSTPNGTYTASSIAAGHSYKFSLRAATTSCSTPDPTATEIGYEIVDGATATISATTANGFRMGAKPVLVPRGQNPLGSTTINFAATYSVDASGNCVPGPSGVQNAAQCSNIVWVSMDGGPFSNFTCSPSTNGTGTAPWIVAGSTYRFSLRPVNPATTPCNTTTLTGREVAAVTVKGYQDYLVATPDRCSAASNDSCETNMSFGTSSTAAAKIIEKSSDNVHWTQYACFSASSGNFATNFVPHDTTAYYRLRPASSCSDTTAPATATAQVHALSGLVTPGVLPQDGLPVGDIVPPNGSFGLQLGGQPFKGMGMNKWDLFRQYLMKPDFSAPVACPSQGVPPPLDTCPTSSPTTGQCQAEQDMADAASKGIQYFRILGTGFYPAEMVLWQSCPTVYWQKFDRMLSVAKSKGLRLVVDFDANLCKFPRMLGEQIGDMIKNPNSLSQQKLFAYAQDLVTRYPNDTGIVAWELLNELNTIADLSLKDGSPYYCAIPSDAPSPAAPSYPLTTAADFQTDDMVKFMQRFASAVRGWDPNHLISSGYGDPREAASALWANPGFLLNPYGQLNPNTPWHPEDDQNMMEQYVQYIHPDPIDLVSMHFYNGDVGNGELDNDRLGYVGAYNADVLNAYVRAADRANKPLYLGEHNDAVTGQTDLHPFDRAVLKVITDRHIPLSTFWAWELRDGPVQYSLAPNVTSQMDELISLFQSTTSTFNATSWGYDMTGDMTAQNQSFEVDSNADGTPDGFTKSGSGTVSLLTPSPVFNGKAVKLAPTSGSLTLDSQALMIGTSAPATAKLSATVAALTSSTIPTAQLCLLTYTTLDGTGTATTTCANVTGTPNAFKVFSMTAPASGVKSARVRLLAGTSGYAEFDDVRVSFLK